MSRYSGKHDCCDHFWMGNNTEKEVQQEIDRTDFYMWSKGRRIKLDIHTVKDLVPYYPFLIGMSCGSKEGRNVVILANESFVDQEEREFMGWELRDALAEYKKCKRKKIPFNPDAYLANAPRWCRHNYTEEIVRRVAKDGLKANLDGLHSDTKDKWDRASLARLMKQYGYDDNYINIWVFGWRKEYPDWNKEEE